MGALSSWTEVRDEHVKTHKHTHQPKTNRGICLRCRKRLPPVARKHRDPFCSRVCAEATYGTGRRSETGRLVIGGLPIVPA